jgi:hypothetical protein
MENELDRKHGFLHGGEVDMETSSYFVSTNEGYSASIVVCPCTLYDHLSMMFGLYASLS